MGGTCVVNVLGGIEPQPIQMEFPDPVCGVRQIKLTNRPAVHAIEVDGVAPIGRVLQTEIIVAEFPQIVSVRTQVVVDDVQNDAHLVTMRGIDKGAELMGSSI